jgi:hypothetical protein
MDPASLMLIAHIIDTLLLGVEMAPSVFDHLTKLSEDIRSMVEHGRDPNAGEWMDMESRLRAELDKLKASGMVAEAGTEDGRIGAAARRSRGHKQPAPSGKREG